jgi:protein-tyrosine phosphatase
MKKILFVCLGNICRSPLAEALFNHKIKLLKLDHQFYVDSCGTGDYHIGSQPDPLTIRSAIENGVEILHACRQLTVNDLLEFDFIIAMDKSNHVNIMRFAKLTKAESKVFLMREFDFLMPGADVPDPYHGDARDFKNVFDILNRSLDGFIAHLNENHST